MVCLPPVHSASLYHAYAHKNNAFFISSSFPFLSSFHSSQDHMPSSLPTAPKVSFLTGYHIVSRIQTRSRYQFLVRTNRLEASQGALLLCSAVNSESCGTLFQEEATTLPSIPTLSHDDANLSIFVMNAVRPWTWFSRDDKGVNRLHYQSEPVPGVYLIHPEGRYLVAMRPTGMPRDATFFSDHIWSDDLELDEDVSREAGFDSTSCKTPRSV